MILKFKFYQFFILDKLPCLFCDQLLPNPLPKKLLEYLRMLQQKGISTITYYLLFFLIH